MGIITSPGESDLDATNLNGDEVDRLQLALERGLHDIRTEGTSIFQRKLMEYEEEIMEAASVAKEKFGKSFGGQAPSSTQFGIDRIHSGYFGYDSWSNCPDASAGSTQVWLDNSVPDNLSGSGGSANPLVIGEPVVHLVLGVGSYAENPKTGRVQFEFNETPKPCISTEVEFFNSDIPEKYLDSPFLLDKDDQVFSEYYSPENGTEELYLQGITFIEQKDYRILDPSDMAGTNDEDIVRQ